VTEASKHTISAVFDCMVFLQAIGSPGGPARACIRLAELGETQVNVSDAILTEVAGVLSRPSVLSRYFEELAFLRAPYSTT
jgi:predicted nucleic acid-binding protein